MIKLFQRLKYLSKEQTKAIKDQDVELLQDLIHQKQDLIDEISAFQNESEQVQLSESDKKKIKATISEQLKIDKNNEGDLAGLMVELKSNLTEVVKGKAAAKSYYPDVTSGPRFFDTAG